MEWSGGCDSFSAENGHCEFVAEATVGAGWEEVCRCININHGHGKSSEATARLDIYMNRTTVTPLYFGFYDSAL
jgi:hypothetical protein